MLNDNSVELQGMNVGKYVDRTNTNTTWVSTCAGHQKTKVLTHIPPRDKMVYLYPFSWHVGDNTNEIQVYGWTVQKEYICLRITGFTPFCYISVPYDNDQCITRLRNELFQRFPKEIFKSVLVRRKGLYSNVLDPPRPYLLTAFHNERARKHVCLNLRKPINLYGIGAVKLQVYENRANCVLQLTCLRQISTMGWLDFSGTEVELHNRVSLLAQEYTTFWKNIHPIQTPPTWIPEPTILSYDIECYSHCTTALPNPKHPSDVIFQISCVVVGPAKIREKYLLSLGDPDESHGIHSDITVLTFPSEKLLLIGFSKLIQQLNPQLIIGYNIFGFDNRYVLERSRLLYVFDEVGTHGCTNERPVVNESKWSTNAMSNMEFYCLLLKGRVYVDVLYLVRKDYLLPRYTLDAVSAHFLQATKDPLTHYDIFRCWEEKTPESLALCGNYCVRDSDLTLSLFLQLEFWYSLVAMATVCNLQITDLLYHGQQIKVFSQVYKYCYNNCIVVEMGRYTPSPNEHCKGAFVLDAHTGLYENVVSFDFASLYPSIMMSHNIDYTTLVRDDTVPDDQCHIIEWDEHINCGCENSEVNKAVERICKPFRYRWLKEPVGVLPTIVKSFIDARKSARAQLAITDPNTSLARLLNVTQNAYKVSANSVYGALAVQKGYLPFFPAAQSITAIGRRSLVRVKELIEREHHGVVIYGDSDSNYVKFRHIQPEQLDEHCRRIATQVSQEFPPPMKLEYEGAVYEKYLLLTKKRYIYRERSSKGEGQGPLGSKGVMLRRRDNPVVVRNIYRHLILKSFESPTYSDLLSELLTCIQTLCSTNVPIEEYATTKSVKGIDKMVVSPRSETKVFYGTYVVSALSTDPEKREKQMELKNVQTEDEFYRAGLPAHVQLAMKMRDRGQPVGNGSRLSFVVMAGADKKATLSSKLQDLDYFVACCHRSSLDINYYLHLLLTPITELFGILFPEVGFTGIFKKLLKTIDTHRAMLQEFHRLVKPHLEFTP